MYYIKANVEYTVFRNIEGRYTLYYNVNYEIPCSAFESGRVEYAETIWNYDSLLISQNARTKLFYIDINN